MEPTIINLTDRRVQVLVNGLQHAVEPSGIVAKANIRELGDQGEYDCKVFL